MQKVLANRGILFVTDEVQTGWGRTGEHFWGYQAHDVVPDMLTFAKGVGNGITLAGIVARAEIMGHDQGAELLYFWRQSAVYRCGFGHLELRAGQRPPRQRPAHGQAAG